MISGDRPVCARGDDGTRTRWHSVGFLLLLVLAVGYWFWVGLTQRSIVGDDGISILAAEGILDHGYPRLPSGLIYHRAFLPGYLLAASIYGFGLNDLAIMLPSLVMAAGSLFLTFRFGRDVLRQPVAGLFAAAFLVLVSEQTFYATSARMYLSLQFFTMLALYAGWRAFFDGRRSFEWVVWVATAGAIFCHQQGGVLLVMLPISVLAIRHFTKNPSPLSFRRLGVGWVALFPLFWFASIFEPKDIMRQVISFAGVDPGFAGLNLDLKIWGEHLRALESILPFYFVLIPIALMGVIGAFRGPRSPAADGLLYGLANLVLFSAALLVNVLVFSPRMWVAILPLLLVVSLAASVHALEVFRAEGGLRLAVCVATLAIVGLGFALGERPAQRVLRGYGRPCVETICQRSMALAYRALDASLTSEIRVVATNPWVAHYYLGHVDGVLRERWDGDSFGPFEETTDEYFGIEIVDRPDRLAALGQSTQPVWVIADAKIRGYTGPEMRERLRTSFVLLGKSRGLLVFRNRSVADRMRTMGPSEEPMRDSTDGVIGQKNDSHSG